MALIVTPGPVPQDGTRIRIAEEMTAFVQGTDITGFGKDNFVDAPIDFVISATDPPATDSRTRGTFWFARGEGTLYNWQAEPIQSGNFSPSEAGSNVSQAHWISVSNRKEIMVKSRWGWAAGEKIQMNGAISEWKMSQSELIDGQSRFTMVMSSTSPTNNATGEGMDFVDAVGLTQAAQCDPFFTTKEAAVDGQYAIVVDCGFADVKVAGPGSNGVHPQVAMHSADADPHYTLVSTGATGWNNTSCVVGMIAESSASNAERLLQVLVYAQSSNIVRPTGNLYSV